MGKSKKTWVVAPYTLEIEFNDSVKQIIDFSSTLNGELLASLRDLSLFNQVKLDPEIYTITWPNGADFDPATLHDWDLYKDEIIAHTQKWAMVAEDQTDYNF